MTGTHDIIIIVKAPLLVMKWVIYWGLGNTAWI